MVVGIAVILANTVRVAHAAAIDWPTLGFTEVVTNTFTFPTCIAHPGDGSGRLFVAELKGRVWIIRDGALLPQPFLDVTRRVMLGGERGFLGLAFPPDFATNSHFYVNYTRKPDGATVIARFSLTDDPNLADENSQQIVLVIPQPDPNHNGGNIAFGPDGYLYVGMGDGGGVQAGDRAQDKSTLLGKMLRIDVEGGAEPYGIPPDNPFVDVPNAAPEIWALGLRNPWRFSFDRGTGDLYIGDVGEDRYEEIHFQPAGSVGGENYGWRIMEGPTNHVASQDFTNYSAFAAPVTWYDHAYVPTSFSASITGGYVYRGPGEPRLNGIYVFGDFVAGWLWGLKRDGAGWQRIEFLNPPAPWQSSEAAAALRLNVSTFGEDEEGRLHLADFNKGKIFRIHETHRVWTPAFAGTNRANLASNTVVITSLSPNAQIHYTTNGIDPTLSDPVVPPDGIIQVASGLTNKAKAFRPDLNPSEVAQAVFTLRVGTPTFTPPPGPITNGTPVSISTATPGARIYYTTNGLPPTTNSSIYSGPVRLTGGLTLRVLAVANSFNNSLVAISSYSVARAATPQLTPAGSITNGTPVSMSSATPGAVIFYTLDGSIPTTNSDVYAGPISIDVGTTVNAFAVASGYADSAVQSVTYELARTATPVFTPDSATLAYGTEVSISSATPGAAIYYTLDGSMPTTNSALYSGPLPITSDITLGAIAIAPGLRESLLYSVALTLAKTAAPLFSPAGGQITNGTLIAISSTTSNAVIHYTLDGSEPDTNSLLFTAPILFSNSFTLKARAFSPRRHPSNTTSPLFAFWNPEGTVVSTFAGGPESGLSNAVGTLARFFWPQALWLDSSGNFYVADSGNYAVRKILPSGEVSTLAGTGFEGFQDGPAAQAEFSNLTGVCADGAGNVYVADARCHRIRKIDAAGTVSTLLQSTDCETPCGIWQMEIDSGGNLYLGASGSILKIMPHGASSELAWLGHCSFKVGIGLDVFTNVYASIAYDILKVAADGSTQNLTPRLQIYPGFADGPVLQSFFEGPQDITVDSTTNVFISDLTRIRTIRHDGQVTTLAGTGVPGYRNGRGAEAQFRDAKGLCVDTNGNVYVADMGNHCIRKISRDSAGIGIADEWQRVHFGHIGIDPNGDPDHDGMSNHGEFWAGTNPIDSNSVLMIDSLTTVTNNYTRITWQAVPGKTYTVKRSNDLITWTIVARSVRGTGPMASVLDSTTITAATRRFYRVFGDF